MNPDECLWIGYLGAEVPATSCLNARGVLTQSFIGGRELISLPGSQFTQSPLCNICDLQLILIVQLYWPLHSSSYDRIIHVFACRNSSCWNQSDSWKVFRSLANDETFLTTDSTKMECKPMFEVSDWDDEPDNAELGDLSSCPMEGADAANFLPTELEGLSLEPRKGNCLQLEKGLSSYMLEYFEASCLSPMPADNTHEMLLYNEYMMNDQSETNANAIDDLEETVVFSDKTSEKFYTEINLFPSQVIRYQRGGAPLWTCDKFAQDLGLVPNCEVCGGKRTFEFQLLPTLVESLRIEGQKSPAVEFGSVFVFTCTANCWESKGSSLRAEFAFVQPDPDVHSLLESQAKK